MAIEKLIEQAGGSLGGWDAVRIVTAMDRQQEDTDILPREVEIEINTATSLRIDGYPHREHRGGSSRAEMPLSQFEKIVADLREYDDICLTIGGIGEPLAHRDLIKMIEAAKAAGIMGINIETDGRLLKDELAERLLASQVDTISVYLDAEGAVLYQQIKGEDRLEGIVGEMESFIDTSDGRGPQIVPHLVKTRATMVEMEAFYDRWISRCGCAVITGYNDFAGQIEDKAVMDMSPPRRRPCRRLSGCMTILADGSATVCSQDFMGRCAIGNVNDKSVSQLWRSEKMEQLRRAHRGGRFDVNELCGRCKEWHR
jgi:spiro-SPASM protein